MKTNPRSIWTNPIHFIACGFGAGAFPIMPGTMGTLVGVLLYLILATLTPTLYIIITVIVILVGIKLCDITQKDFGIKDHPAIVWDEITGFLLVMIGVPNTWYYIVIGFILFRVFDIWKPIPIRWVDTKVIGGLGVMLDDIIAAIYSWIILQGIIWIIK